MLIKEQPLQHWIDNFYGYGSWDAKTWFISYEEGGGDLPEDVAERLNYFHDVHPSGDGPTLCDIRDLYRRVSARIDGPRANIFASLYDYRFGNNAILHGAWKNLITFQHAYNGKKIPDLLQYQKSTFASPSKHNEALINFYPLPSPHNHAWYYSWLDMPEFSYLKSRASYQDHVYKARITGILKNIEKHKPAIVLMYGMSNINELRKSVQEIFPSAKFKMIGAIKQQIPQHHWTEFNGTTMLITTQVPTLRHNRVESGFDWEAFGKMIKPGR